MNASSVSFSRLSSTARSLSKLLLTIGENRFELLTLEMQEERERLLHALFLASCVAVCGLLAGIAVTAVAVVLFWEYSPMMVLLAFATLYTITGLCLLRRLAGELQNRQPLSASLDQLRKDRACLEKIID
jgi:uncharacterized membrane protein YqjE